MLESLGLKVVSLLSGNPGGGLGYPPADPVRPVGTGDEGPILKRNAAPWLRGDRGTLLVIRDMGPLPFMPKGSSAGVDAREALLFLLDASPLILSLRIVPPVRGELSL